MADVLNDVAGQQFLRGEKCELPIGLDKLHWTERRSGMLFDDGMRLLVAVPVNDPRRDCGYRYQVDVVHWDADELYHDSTGDLFGWSIDDVDWLVFIDG